MEETAKTTLPGYEKRSRIAFLTLPKDPYVVEIKGAKLLPNSSGTGQYLAVAFDIAEGKYAGFYDEMYRNDSRIDKKWPSDAVLRLTVPTEDSPNYVWRAWNYFFSDLEDSNEGFEFEGDLSTLRGKILGGKFRIEQSEYNGVIYDHTRLHWTCTADAVRKGRAGKMPEDKLLSAEKTSASPEEGRGAAEPAGDTPTAAVKAPF